MKHSSDDFPTWRDESEYRHLARLYNFNASRVSRTGSQSVDLDGQGTLAPLIARQAPFATVIERLISSLCSTTGAACGLSFIEDGRLRTIAGPQRLAPFWRAHAGTTATTEFQRARQRGEFANPSPIGDLGQTVDAAELRMLAETIGFHGYIAVPLGNGHGPRDMGVLESFYEEQGISARKIAQVRTAARIARLAFACRS